MDYHGIAESDTTDGTEHAYTQPKGGIAEFSSLQQEQYPHHTPVSAARWRTDQR